VSLSRYLVSVPGQVLPALRSPNYRLFFAGQGLSLVGLWMSRTATLWLVYDLTRSSVWLGVTGFAYLIPSLLLAPVGGVLVDRWNRYRLLLFAQMAAMLPALLLAWLTFGGQLQLGAIIGLGFAQGVIKAIEAPTRQAFVPQLVEREGDLISAIALNASLFNGARLIGPAIAGLILAHLGAGYCFLLDGLSYIAIIVALLLMRLPTPSQSLIHPPPASFWQRFTEGLRYARQTPPLLAILGTLALVSFMGLQYAVIVPLLATEVLDGGPETLGLLMASLGIGALVAGAYLSIRDGVVGLENLVAIAPVVMGSGLVSLAFTTHLGAAILIMSGMGAGFLLQTAASNTLIQFLVEDDKRGRIMSLYLVALLGTIPLGNLFVGSLIGLVGLSATLVVTGMGCMSASLIFLSQRSQVRILLLHGSEPPPEMIKKSG
jgi:MFS family permease